MALSRLTVFVVGLVALLGACGWFDDDEDDALRPVDVSEGISYPGSGCVLGDALYPPVEDSVVFLRGSASDFAQPVAMVPLVDLSRVLNPGLEPDEHKMFFGDEDTVGVATAGLRFEGEGRASYEQPDLLLFRLGMWSEVKEFAPDAEVLVLSLGFPVEVPVGEVPPLGGRAIEFVNSVFVREGDGVVAISCDRSATVDYLEFIAAEHNTTPWLALVGLTTGEFEAIEEPPSPQLVPFGQRGPLGRTFADSDTPRGVGDRLIDLTITIAGEVPEGKVV